MRFLERERQIHPLDMDVGAYFRDYLEIAEKGGLCLLREIREELLRKQQEGLRKLEFEEKSLKAFAEHKARTGQGATSEAEMESMLTRARTRAYKEDIQPPAKKRRLVIKVLDLYHERQISLGFKVLEEFSDSHKLSIIDPRLHDAIEVLADVILDSGKRPKSLSRAYRKADERLRKSGSFRGKQQPTDAYDSVEKRGSLVIPVIFKLFNIKHITHSPVSPIEAVGTGEPHSTNHNCDASILSPSCSNPPQIHS